MNAEKRKITSEDRLKALALVTIANAKYREAMAFERALKGVLGLSMECIGDDSISLEPLTASNRRQARGLTTQ